MKIKKKKKTKQLFKIIVYLSFEAIMFVLPISMPQVHCWFSMKELKSFKFSTPSAYLPKMYRNGKKCPCAK